MNDCPYATEAVMGNSRVWSVSLDILVLHITNVQPHTTLRHAMPPCTNMSFRFATENIKFRKSILMRFSNVLKTTELMLYI